MEILIPPPTPPTRWYATERIRPKNQGDGTPACQIPMMYWCDGCRLPWQNSKHECKP